MLSIHEKQMVGKRKKKAKYGVLSERTWSFVGVLGFFFFSFRFDSVPRNHPLFACCPIPKKIKTQSTITQHGTPKLGQSDSDPFPLHPAFFFLKTQKQNKIKQHRRHPATTWHETHTDDRAMHCLNLSPLRTQPHSNTPPTPTPTLPRPAPRPTTTPRTNKRKTKTPYSSLASVDMGGVGERPNALLFFF